MSGGDSQNPFDIISDMKYHIWTEGCQMNVADSLRIASALEHLGYQPTDLAEEANVIVLNTCVVRQSAEDKAYGRLQSLTPLKKKKPELVIIRIFNIYLWFENRYGLFRHAGFFIGPSQILIVPALVERIESDCLLHLLNRLFRLADIDEEVTHFREKLRIVRIEFPRALVTGHRLLVFPFV